MGNRVAVSVPSQILPIEFYLKELSDIHVKASLGNTCFLKVACCLSREGLVVVKVFVNNENHLKLEPYRDLLHRVHDHLDNAAPNCLMYAAVKITDTAGVLLRQHVDKSLHERISTRPFLTHLEKTWLAFQLLCALRQAHQAQVYHGDIKSENVLVTASGWLQLTDFAPFKPVTLPDNDPSDFTYFFDTSRRRTCYIAPERFRYREGDGRDVSPDGEALEREASPSPNPPLHNLTPAMDVFSAGCVLVELFTEGYAPFDLTQLLAYRKELYHPTRLVDKIHDPHVQTLVMSMLSRDPCQRRGAGDYLEEQRGLAFPDYFYSFLWPYGRQFAGHPKRPPDVTIQQISESLNDILLNLCGEKVAELDKTYMARCGAPPSGQGTRGADAPPGQATRGADAPSYRLHVKYGRGNDQDDESATSDERCEALILVLPFITAAYRSAALCSSKLLGLQTLMRVARFCPDDVILDRLLPTMLVGVESAESSVRACAVDCITHSLALVAAIPRRDANIFPEYIVPSLAKLVNDPCVLVRQALAENVATIAHTAQRFLDWSLHSGYFSSREYDVELKNLCDSLQQMVTLLIMDPSNIVKRTFMQNTRGHLWTFFGLARANDLIMKHMITYLNDTQDYQLRRDFFECLRVNALMVGPYQGDIFLPLLMQCMNDSEEWVVVAALGALIAMCKVDIFSNPQLLGVLGVTLPLLLHPNTVIRQSIVHLVCAVCALLDPVDVLANVRPLMAPYIAPHLAPHLTAIDYTNELCVMSALCARIPRRAWRTLLSFTDLRGALERLRDGLDHPRLSLTKYLEASLPTGHASDDKTLRRLLAQGLDETLAGAVVRLEQHLLGVHSHRRATLQGGAAGGDGGSLDDRGEIQVASAEVCRRGAPPEILRYSLSCDDAPALPGTHRRSGSMGAGEGGSAPSPSGGTGPSSGPSALTEVDSFPAAQRAAAAAPDNVAVPSGSEMALRQVVKTRRRLHQLRARRPTPAGRSSTSTPAGRPPASTPAGQVWAPAGVLISHLHEHTARVHRLCTLDKSSIFASASHDGSVRIWDAHRTDKDSPVNRSRGVYGRLGASVRCLAASAAQQCVAAAADNGNIHVFRLDKLSMLCDRVLDREEDVYAVDMAFYDTGCGDNVVVYGSVTGGVVGWDLRQPGTAWRFNNGPKNGLITSLMVDRDSNFLAVGTSKGYVTCWDIRFQLPITQIKHESGHHIRRLAKNPCDSRTAFAAVTGNNEVGLWELDTNYRTQTLWASPKEPLNHKEASSKNINGVCVGALGSGEGACDVFAVTGGSDCCLRYWNLQQPRLSKVVAHAACDHPAYPDTSFREVRVEQGGNTVIVEDRLSSHHRKDSSSSPWVMSSCNPADLYDPHRPASGHKDTITDVVLVDVPQRFIVSSDAMGVVKIWK